MLGKQDLFLFVNFLLHCLHLIATNYFQIETNVNCPEISKEIKEFKTNIFLDNIFKNQKLKSITYFFLKDYNKFLITFFYFSNLKFYISGELHFIFWVAVFGVMFNQMVCFIKSRSKVFRSIVEKTDYCCIGAYKSQTVLLVVAITSGSNVYKEQLRCESILKATRKEQIDAILELRRLESTPFETLVKNFYSVKGYFNYSPSSSTFPNMEAVKPQEDYFMKKNVFVEPKIIIVEETAPQLKKFINIETVQKHVDFGLEYSNEKIKKG